MREERRHLAVGAFPSAIATIVPEALVRMRAADPDLEVNVAEGTLDELVAAVRDGTLHLAVVFQDAAAPRRDHEALERRDLFEEPWWRRFPRRTVSRAEIRSTWRARRGHLDTPSRDGLVYRTCLGAGFGPTSRL